MFSQDQQIQYAESRRRELLREARLQRLYQQAEQDRPHFASRMMMLVGDLMISGGSKLKARSGADAPTEWTLQKS